MATASRLRIKQSRVVLEIPPCHNNPKGTPAGPPAAKICKLVCSVTASARKCQGTQSTCARPLGIIPKFTSRQPCSQSLVQRAIRVRLPQASFTTDAPSSTKASGYQRVLRVAAGRWLVSLPSSAVSRKQSNQRAPPSCEKLRHPPRRPRCPDYS